ncbi:phosphatase domain-containing protein [Leucobacter sp. HY1910]
MKPQARHCQQRRPGMDHREAVIVDVDGTLCDVSGIRHYVTAHPRRRNFDQFHRASAICPAIPDSLAWVEAHRALGRAVIIVTARERRYEFITRRWLRKWGIRNDLLLMRANGDPRRDDFVKADILAQIRACGFNVVAAIDDNPVVVALWRRERIPVTVVSGWHEQCQQGTNHTKGEKLDSTRTGDQLEPHRGRKGP